MPRKFRVVRGQEDPSDIFNDLAALRGMPTRATRREPKKWRRRYVIVPWAWVEKLRQAKRVSTYRLALLLLYEHWRQSSSELVLSNVLLRDEGIASRSKTNALAELEAMGLVRVKRRLGRSPRIVVIVGLETP